MNVIKKRKMTCPHITVTSSEWGGVHIKFRKGLRNMVADGDSKGITLYSQDKVRELRDALNEALGE